MSARNRLVTVVIEVEDLERSARLYADGFGLELRRSDHEGAEHGTGDRWISGGHAAITWNEGAFLHFALYQAKGEPTTGAPLSFAVDDLAVAHDAAIAAGPPWCTSRGRSHGERVLATATSKEM